ncbi:MAG TPA: hypothetical protein VH988_09130 [Thermoanaerobaculia bacterium]|nr:hypothetical protein [Thermoanaerobaculia bacterium]
MLAEQKAQQDYDKAVISLSGGALAVSFAFIEKIVGKGPAHSPKLLFFAWVLWAASIASVMASYFLSRLALRKAIHQVDSQSIYLRRPGGWGTLVTEILNVTSGCLFVMGVIVAAEFIYKNF